MQVTLCRQVKEQLVLRKWLEDGMMPPSKWYVENILGDFIFIKATTYDVAKAYVDGMWPGTAMRASQLAHRRNDGN